MAAPGTLSIPWADLHKRPGLGVPYYLVASYCYYVHDHSPLTDPEFDKLGKFLLERIEELNHRHADLLDADSLAAGTLYKLRPEDYPWIVRSNGDRLIRAARG